MIRGVVSSAAARPKAQSSAIGQPGSYNFDSGVIPEFMPNASLQGWHIVTDATPDIWHTKALRAKAITNNQVTQFTFKVNTTSAANNLKIRFKVNSEAAYDFFFVYIDGVTRVEISGVQSTYTEVASSLTSGEHTVLFGFKKDTVDIDPIGSDTVFISQIDIS